MHQCMLFGCFDMFDSLACNITYYINTVQASLGTNVNMSRVFFFERNAGAPLCHLRRGKQKFKRLHSLIYKDKLKLKLEEH